MSRSRTLFVSAFLLLSTLGGALAGCYPHTVEPGNVGVQTHWGEVQPTSFGEGFHWLRVMGDRMVEMDARIQKLQSEATASSSDLQTVTSVIALNYRIDGARAIDIYRDIGTLSTVEATVIKPALQEAVKTATARYTAEQLITRRADVKADITAYITATMERSHVIVTELSIVDFNFSKAYNKAVEDKQIAEQRSLTATNDLARIRIEAEQVEAEAQGAANASLIKAEAEASAQALLIKTLNDDILELRAIEKWDGALPQVATGGEGLELALSPLAR